MKLYEVKLPILQKLLTLMKSEQADKYMKAFDAILDNPPDNSIFRMNMNPLRVGL